jgi:hypothetical protein
MGHFADGNIKLRIRNHRRHNAATSSSETRQISLLITKSLPQQTRNDSDVTETAVTVVIAVTDSEGLRQEHDCCHRRA